ncbi:hypothetical protein EVAR_31313_1 [Eumeta japonica]|uniref:Uncharacterized protein n=1 Tax=Eumeta variegata TaxID=151549 RepID=A0A4C1VPY7_EUMVA|nr:hypothetical protein EVAR_31313_1 [Eumeta japonica]
MANHNNSAEIVPERRQERSGATRPPGGARQPTPLCTNVRCATNRARVSGRIWLERAFQEQSRDTHKTLHGCWESKRLKACKPIYDSASSPAAGATEHMQVNDVIASISALDYIDINYVRTPIIEDTFSSS